MSNFAVSQLTYVSIIILLCLAASAFYFLRPLRKINHNINADKYLSLFFLVFAAGFAVFSFFIARENTISVFATTTLLIAAFAYLKAAFVSRHTEKTHSIVRDKTTLVIFSICLFINLSLLHFVEGSQIARTVTIIISISIIIVTIIPHVSLTPNVNSIGDTLAINALKLSLIIMAILMTVLLITTNQFYYISALTACLSLIIIIIFGSTLTMFLSEVADMYHKESSLDFLTGLLNRRHFFASSNQILKLSQRQNFDISIIMGDIDDFKFVNDIFGHDVGDKVIIDFASTIKKLTRDTDITARFGGEEFCLLLPYTDIKGANELAERIRHTISQTILASHICDVKYTASFGISSFDKDRPLNSAIIEADRALYYAKEQGKNKVMQFSSEMKLGD